MKKIFLLLFLVPASITAGLRYLTPLKAAVSSALTDIYSLQGDGVNKYVDFGNNYAFERTDPFSFEIWYNKQSTNPSIGTLFSKRSSGQNTGYALIVRPLFTTIKFQMLHNDSTNYIDVGTSSFTFTANTWYQFIVTSSGSSTAAGVKIYANGSALSLSTSSDTLTLSMVNTDPLTIFKDGSSALYIGGALDWFRVWNRALTAGEVTTLYNTGHPISAGVPTGAQSFWPIGKTPEWTDTYNGAINPYVGAIVGTPNNFVSGDFVSSVPP